MEISHILSDLPVVVMYSSSIFVSSSSFTRYNFIFAGRQLLVALNSVRRNTVELLEGCPTSEIPYQQTDL